MKKVKEKENEFHAVEFMRNVREEMTEKFLEDKEKYKEYLREVMADFMLKQKKLSKKTA